MVTGSLKQICKKIRIDTKIWGVAWARISSKLEFIKPNIKVLTGISVFMPMHVTPLCSYPVSFADVSSGASLTVNKKPWMLSLLNRKREANNTSSHYSIWKSETSVPPLCISSIICLVIFFLPFFSSIRLSNNNNYGLSVIFSCGWFVISFSLNLIKAWMWVY